MPRHIYTASGKVAQQFHPPVQTKESRQQVAGPVGENRELDAPSLGDISAEDQSSHALLQTENAVY